MTFSLHLADVANAISQISIAGVTVKDKDEIAGSWTSLPNVLYPKPDGWITDFVIRFDAMPHGVAALSTVLYHLNYRFLGVQVGDIGSFPASYSALIDKFILIINALMAVDAPSSGVVDMQIGPVDIGPKIDPAGNNFFGADFALLIEEQQN